MSASYKVMCGCECCIYDKSIYSSLISWSDKYLKKLKYQIQNAQIIMSGEKAHHIYETYKNNMMPHGHHIYAKAYDISKAKISKYPQYDHELPHWKRVLRCCADFPCINITDQETDKKMKKQQPQLGFTFITSLDVVLLMVEFHLKTNNMLHV